MEAGEDCCVKVAVHVRPLISDEKLLGCKDCVTVVPAKPQVRIGSHSFTFDHVYGSTGSPSCAMFEECVAPLVDGLFQGYNATVLAYGQTGSGKTYTMGTGLKDGYQTGIIPQVMNVLFNKIGTLKHQTEFQLHVSFIEILKEEVRDLLDPSLMSKQDTVNGHVGKATSPGKPPIQIRETSNGVITLAGSTEVSVATLKEMAACLEQGSLSRATGSTNMNNQSSRSHAIFTITLEQKRKINIPDDSSLNDTMNEDYLCAKLHLVDLAGSERAKRTGSDGLRFKEGVHINKGLLALGNVISALGDEKKRKEGLHVPYRDSKLTRLLQDSLGGNSRTVMIACISPADINAEETLNTLKYANRARNIQNKPVINRDPMSNEMLKMRQQVEYLQAELCARAGGSSVEVQVLKERIAWLEAANENLCRELHEYRSRCSVVEQCEKDAHDGSICIAKIDGLRRSLPIIGPDYPMNETAAGDSKEIEEVAKEWEHTLLQNSMDKELHELNKRLEQKESEMKLFGASDAEVLKQHFGRKIMELEDEKRVVQRERDCLLAEVENLAANSDGQTQKLEDIHAHKLKALEAQIMDLKRKQESQVQLMKQKQKSDEAAKRLQDEIQSIKAQKVQLQQRIKQEAEQFRQWKASREKELLQLKKEGRRNEYERHKLQALNQRQKMVLQRKTEEAAMATKRLKDLLEARKTSIRDTLVTMNGSGTNGQSNEKSLQRWLDHELEVMIKEQEVRFEYEKQSQVRAALAEELAMLKQVNEFTAKGLSPPRGKNGFTRASYMSPHARMARIASLENMLIISSNSLVAMASQLSEAEERERAITSRGRWNQLRSMGEAKNLLQYMFNSVADARCQLWEKDTEIREMKDQIKELVGLLRQSEMKRKEVEKELKVREQAVATALATPASGNSPNSLKHYAEDMKGPSSPMPMPTPKQLKFMPGVANGLVRESAAFTNQKSQMVPIGQLSMKKLAAVGQASGKLWKWKRSHHQWLLQFKWKWQKPWRLSELIRHSDETIMKTRPRSQALLPRR
ncbi:PREDICTED: kinesin-like protein KIN-4A isoform X5 [Lupinus angustifolius]|uniref:kinesin-like protein KIN-4A isoform X4 n=1 Tax=Lupinus angustifolius TaxID=3871 RepID=UPI00092E892E|nr:PREDICTED: kinesin-like protein KIN-4A isoform X4 [Lupinus angustifolius]XP_019437937.1 PREDICTED: kinesin-like protein KIN-4A isoform X5 [Lupinus angustifolius]